MQTNHAGQYNRFFIMISLSFVAMYLLMYAMIDSFANFFFNINQFYMAALMTSPMIILEIVLMGEMYGDKKMNSLIIIGAFVLLFVSFLFIQQQTFVSDKQFLRSMIPHHAGAILMCKKADLRDPEIKQLCSEILAGQKREVAQMKTKLYQLR